MVNYLKMNNEYLKGTLDAKLSKLLQESDYNVFASFDEEKQIEYLLNLNVTNKLTTHDFEAVCKEANTELANEIKSYIGIENPIFKYFFTSDSEVYERFQKTKYLNSLYEQVSETSYPSLSKFMNVQHLLINLLVMYRLKALNEPKEMFQDYMLSQNLISAETLLNLYPQNVGNINAFIKQELQLEFTHETSLNEIENSFDEYLLAALQEFSYSPDLEATIIYYIFMKKQEIHRLRKIYYTKGLN